MIIIAAFYINSIEKTFFFLSQRSSMMHFLPSLRRREEGDALWHISSKHLLPVALEIVPIVRAHTHCLHL